MRRHAIVRRTRWLGRALALGLCLWLFPACVPDQSGGEDEEGKQPAEKCNTSTTVNAPRCFDTDGQTQAPSPAATSAGCGAGSDSGASAVEHTPDGVQATCASQNDTDCNASIFCDFTETETRAYAISLDGVQLRDDAAPGPPPPSAITGTVDCLCPGRPPEAQDLLVGQTGFVQVGPGCSCFFGLNMFQQGFPGQTQQLVATMTRKPFQAASCSNDADCLNPAFPFCVSSVCNGGLAHDRCTERDDCRLPDFECIDGECNAVDGLWEPCDGSSPCEDGFFCNPSSLCQSLSSSP